MKISVALCTYNGEQFLRQQIESILQQTLQVNEIVIGDDGSTDGTIAIIKEYKHQYSNLIHYIINGEQLGAVKNFESTVRRCTGDIIFLSDQDDYWVPGKVRHIIDFFKKQKNALLVFTDAGLIDDNNKMLPDTLWEKWGFTEEHQFKWQKNRKAFNDLLQNINKATGATVAFRSALRKNSLPITVPPGYWHDAWFALHAAAMNGLYFIKTPLVKYRIHHQQQVGITKTISVSINNTNISYEEMHRKIAAMYPGFFRSDSKIKKGIKKIRKIIFSK